MATKAKQARAEEAMEAAESTGRDPAVIAAAASVGLSLYLFFARGDRERGAFVGLWPPTILAFASYFRQTEMKTEFQRAMVQSEGMRGTVERIIGNQ